MGLVQTTFHSVYSFQIRTDGYYKESVYDQGVNLTVGVSNRNLEWFMNLTIYISVKGTLDEPISNAGVLLQISTTSYVVFGYNLSLDYILWDRQETIYNGSKEIEIYISHVPTQQPYTLSAVFINATQTGPNITYALYIASIREGIVSIETFMVAYIGIFIISGILLVLFKKGIIKINQKTSESSNVYA